MTAEDLTAIRRQLSDGQNMVRETVDRLRQSQEENEMISRRKEELESRVATLETEYEELLGMSLIDFLFNAANGFSMGLQRRPSMMRRPAMWTSQSRWRTSRFGNSFPGWPCRY